MNGVLERALTGKQKVEMVYMDSGGGMTQRTLRVVSVQEETLLAYCYWRKQVRLFKRDNILAAYPCKDRKANKQSR
ncbi:WYL domain-containing protein [Salimicrobium flavidum]|uniref:WYL domain-containing protein n=1 Tax=Salimicrobium flavidum TaxID=570947 RepID=A0A1N7JJN8_9BACI|nr:hypothetical protein SAMN05421687_106153 [Salimicrobium flavidum]